jgi:hypothetical protein
MLQQPSESLCKICHFASADCRIINRPGNLMTPELQRGLRPAAKVVYRFGVAVSLALLFLLGACGGTGGNSTQGPPTLSSIAVSAAASTLTAGQSQQYAAKATYSDGSTKDVTATANWASSVMTFATDARGRLVTSLVTGATQISASLSGVTGMARLTVNMPIPASWTPMGVDYGIKKQCNTNRFPDSTQFLLR